MSYSAAQHPTVIFRIFLILLLAEKKTSLSVTFADPPPPTVTFCHFFEFQNTYNNFFSVSRIFGFLQLLLRGSLYNRNFGLLDFDMRRDLRRPFTIVILSNFFSRLRRAKNI